MNFDFVLPLTNEEQASLLLWEKIRPHIKDTIEDVDAVKQAVADVLFQYGRIADTESVDEI